MKYIFIALVRLYQKYISPKKTPCCRFTPTCSQSALEAFKERGAIVGLGLTVWRILRCNPASKGGYDPVPQKKQKEKKRKNKDTNYLSDKASGRK